MLSNNKYIQKSLSRGWGEKTKLSREFLSNTFSIKTIERTLFTSYCLWLTQFIARFFLSNKIIFIFELSNELQRFKTCDEIS